MLTTINKMDLFHTGFQTFMRTAELNSKNMLEGVFTLHL